MDLQQEFIRIVLKNIEIGDLKQRAEQLLRLLLSTNSKEREGQDLKCNVTLNNTVRLQLNSPSCCTDVPKGSFHKYISEDPRSVSYELNSHTAKTRDLSSNNVDVQDDFFLASEINLDESVEQYDNNTVSRNSKIKINESSSVISNLQKELIEIMKGNNIFYVLFNNYYTQQENITIMQKKIKYLERQLTQKETDLCNLEQIMSQNHNSHKVITKFEENVDLNTGTKDLENNLLQRNHGVDSLKKTICELERENVNLMEVSQKYISLVHSKDSLIYWLQQQLTDANKANIYAVCKLLKVGYKVSSSEKVTETEVINDLKMQLADAKRESSEKETAYRSQLDEWKRLYYDKESKCLQQKVKICELSNIITDLHIQLTCTIDILLKRIQDLKDCKVSLKDSHNKIMQIKLEYNSLQLRLTNLSNTSEKLKNTVFFNKFEDSEISGKNVITSTPVKCVVLPPPNLSDQKTLSHSPIQMIFKGTEEPIDDILSNNDENELLPSKDVGIITYINDTEAHTQKLTDHKELLKSHLHYLSLLSEDLNNVSSTTGPINKQISVENCYVITSTPVGFVGLLSPLTDQKAILKSLLQTSSIKNEELKNKIVSSANSDQKTISPRMKKELNNNNISPSYKKYKNITAQNMLPTSADSLSPSLSVEKEFLQGLKSKNLRRNERLDENHYNITNEVQVQKTKLQSIPMKSKARNRSQFYQHNVQVNVQNK